MFNYALDNQEDYKKAIRVMIAFFDLFEYPLTAFEVWRYFDWRISLGRVLAELEASNPEIGQKNGFYFLKGREEIVVTRQKRYNYSNRKLKIARRFIRLFKLWPFIKVIALANTIGAHNLRDGSDIDLFIITTPRRIWLTRLYCAGLAKLLNRRPTAKDKQDKICLSFYISSDHLNLSDLKLTGGDPYFDYWIRNLVLLYNIDKTYEQFLNANGLMAGSPETFKKPSNHFIDCLERLAKSWQLKIMPVALKAASGNSDGVVINDQVLKLYLLDRRREIKEKIIINNHENS